MRCIEYNTGRAIVRIHDGKLTDAERQVVLTEAAQRYFKAIIKQGKGSVLFDKD